MERRRRAKNKQRITGPKEPEKKMFKSCLGCLGIIGAFFLAIAAACAWLLGMAFQPPTNHPAEFQTGEGTTATVNYKVDVDHVVVAWCWEMDGVPDGNITAIPGPAEGNVTCTSGEIRVISKETAGNLIAWLAQEHAVNKWDASHVNVGEWQNVWDGNYVTTSVTPAPTFEPTTMPTATQAVAPAAADANCGLDAQHPVKPGDPACKTGEGAAARKVYVDKGVPISAWHYTSEYGTLFENVNCTTESAGYIEGGISGEGSDKKCGK